MEDQQREDVPAPDLAAEDVRRPATRSMARGLCRARGFPGRGPGGLSLAGGGLGVGSSDVEIGSILGSPFAPTRDCPRRPPAQGQCKAPGGQSTPVQAGGIACNNGYTRREGAVMRTGRAHAGRKSALSLLGVAAVIVVSRLRQARSAGSRGCARPAPLRAQPSWSTRPIAASSPAPGSSHGGAGAHGARCIARSTAGRPTHARSTAAKGRVSRC